jgi:hypothetical protein
VIPNRFVAAALGAFGAAVGIPVALAQLDFAGLFNAFDIDSGDTPAAVLVLAGISGVLTLGVVFLALAGAALALADGPSASVLLSVAAVAGFVSATIFWIPAGVCLGAAVAILGRVEPELAR